MRFCILLRSARSEIFVQSSLGFAEALKALLVPEYRWVVGAIWAYGYVACLNMEGGCEWVC